MRVFSVLEVEVCSLYSKQRLCTQSRSNLCCRKHSALMLVDSEECKQAEHIHTHTFTHTHTHTYTHTHRHTRTRTRAHTQVDPLAATLEVSRPVLCTALVFSHHTHTYMHTHIHTRTHTRTHKHTGGPSSCHPRSEQASAL